MSTDGKVSYDDVTDVIKSISKENLSQDNLLVQIGDIQTYLKLEKDIAVSAKTIRNYGIRNRGYFEKKYPESCTYNTDKNSKHRGLVVNPEKFLDQVEN
jgi:hypothetical protein